NNLIDGNKQNYWSTTDNTNQAMLIFDLKKTTTFDIISLQEFIALGQRIDGFTIDVYEQEKWQEIYAGASIGAKRLIKLNEAVTTQKIRIKIKAPVCITLSEVGIYKYAG
ncbi:MAG: discoidin domain-containing protein, partial [Pedobacter sp.]